MKQCPHGLGCYRKRPEHFYEFSHPPGHKIAEKFVKSTSGALITASPSASPTAPPAASPEKYEKFGLYLTAVGGRSSSWRELTFGKLLRLYDDLETCVHFNYMIDLDFVLQHHPNEAKILLVSGDKLFSTSDTVPKYLFQCNVKLPPYGTHHTKMSILKFKVGS